MLFCPLVLSFLSSSTESSPPPLLLLRRDQRLESSLRQRNQHPGIAQAPYRLQDHSGSLRSSQHHPDRPVDLRAGLQPPPASPACSRQRRCSPTSLRASPASGEARLPVCAASASLLRLSWPLVAVATVATPLQITVHLFSPCLAILPNITYLPFCFILLHSGPAIV